jgi:hypothetical protein
MQFRIKHLLLATVLIALFSWGLAAPSDLSAKAFVFLAWLAVVVLAVRAGTHSGRERTIILCGLFACLSYGVLVAFELVNFPTEDLLKMIHPEFIHKTIIMNGRQIPAVDDNPVYNSFRTIGEITFATMFGLMAAVLAAYWTRTEGGVVENG